MKFKDYNINFKIGDEIILDFNTPIEHFKVTHVAVLNKRAVKLAVVVIRSHPDEIKNYSMAIDKLVYHGTLNPNDTYKTIFDHYQIIVGAIND